MTPRRLVALALLAVLACLVPRAATAAEPPTRVSVLTMGPGEHAFSRFGHDALLLEWDTPRGKHNLVYNFGTFGFRGLGGVVDFMSGRFRYWLSVSTLERTRATYGAARRSLVSQELELDPSQRAELAAALARNALPDRRYYDYDYYRDNCTTRLREALDQVLGGQLRRGVSGAGRLTFRQHTLRLLDQAPAVYLGLNLALGRATDRPITRYEELFLPGELRDELARATVERRGERVPLVRRETTLLEGSFPAAPPQPVGRRAELGGMGLLLGALSAALGRGAARRPALRVAFGVWTALWGVLAGLVGCVLTGFWAFSKHWATYGNYNLLLCPPWALWLGACGIALALGRGWGRRGLGAAAMALVAPSALALLIGWVPAARYGSQELALAFLPLWLGVLAGAKLGAATSPVALAQPPASAGEVGGKLLGVRCASSTGDA